MTELDFSMAYLEDFAKLLLLSILQLFCSEEMFSRTRRWNLLVISGGWIVESLWLCPVGVFVWYVGIFDVLWVWRSVLWSDRYVQQRLLLVSPTSMLLSRYVVFPTSNRREVVLSSPSNHCWMRQSFSLALVSLPYRHVRLLLLVRGFWELLHFWIYFILFSFFLIFYFLLNPTG